MPKTEGREDTDLVEMALEEEVTMSITKLDIDAAVGADEHTASVEDDHNEPGTLIGA